MKPVQRMFDALSFIISVSFCKKGLVKQPRLTEEATGIKQDLPKYCLLLYQTIQRHIRKHYIRDITRTELHNLVL
jgi:hypothetical protein